jgi:hypothetical protein
MPLTVVEKMSLGCNVQRIYVILGARLRCSADRLTLTLTPHVHVHPTAASSQPQQPQGAAAPPSSPLIEEFPVDFFLCTFFTFFLTPLR